MTDSPRDKARKHLKKLSRGAALAVTATIGPVVGACDYCPPPPPPQQCTDADDPATWIFVSVADDDAIFRLTVSLNTFAFTDVTLGNDVAVVSGGTLVDVVPIPDGAQPTSVEIEITPDAGATEVVVEVPVTCVARKDIRITFAVANGAPVNPVTVEEVP